MTILGIETSCDETSAAVIKNHQTLSNVISSQTVHNYFGGVVPEIASRIHIQIISKVVDDSLKQGNVTIEEVDGIAVTYQPGLIGSLVVGTNYAKGISLRFNKPLIPIDHIEGHIYSGFLEGEDLSFPFISLIVSGGHTSLFLVRSFVEYEMIGATRDDAAGEAFDKIGKLLGLGYPAGPKIDKLSKMGNPNRFDFPRGLINSDDLDFSFSGLKTSVRYFLQKNYPNDIPEQDLYDLCASIQEAIVEVLVIKSLKAISKYRLNNIVIAGGVSANSRLRELSTETFSKFGVKVIIPKMQYCMDNAAMIALLGEFKLEESFGKTNFFNYKFKANPTPKRSANK
ncbi:tRNA (adenosine(37)-N6)-threonylcarbamoyltransferase complex transferase subunit TsaD [Bacteroidetes/Chlorobi group bacterium Naka2016]|jgi:N6-L-threonylcarbamoyladenine synthase|nr:MAG: tRNA (adenosine(37)-N6)-threonylcarbamoyltransferase complex transferase subunit TsaD [Bacteroidetes/Chlorobi group bacterium Naka2016]